MLIQIKYLFFSTALFLLGFTSLEAQSNIPELYPQPQKMQLTSKDFPVNNFRLTGNLKVGESSLFQLKKVFNFSDATDSRPFEINWVKKVSPDLQLSGSYKIILSPEKIIINTVDAR